MRKLSSVYMEDLEYLSNVDFIEYEKFRGKTFFISGITGLIGSMLANALAYANDKYSLDIRIVGLVRDIEKARILFTDIDCLTFIEGNLDDFSFPENGIDYIVHAASPTSSKFFNENPVELISVVYNGTERMLQLAKEKEARLIFLSTMEVYGTPSTDDKISETSPSYLNTMSARSSYPEVKRLAENLVASYCAEYGVDGMVLRLTQTFGPGVKYNDGRVFAEFARSAVEKKDIILATKGETKRNYLYVADAVSAILCVLLNGESSSAYNVANEDTYCSIYEMAKLVADKVANGDIDVLIKEDPNNNRGFAPTLHMNLDTTRLRNLGWKLSKNLEAMFIRMIKDFR